MDWLIIASVIGVNGKVRLEVSFSISSIKGNSMDIHILSLFPDMFLGPFHESIIKRAVDTNLVSIQIHNIRDYAPGRHRVVDDYPFGGGGGMVMKPEPLFIALENIGLKLGGHAEIIFHKEGARKYLL